MVCHSVGKQYDLEINLRRYRNNEIELPEILDEFEALVLDDRGLDFLRPL